MHTEPFSRLGRCRGLLSVATVKSTLDDGDEDPEFGDLLLERGGPQGETLLGKSRIFQCGERNARTSWRISDIASRPQ